MSGTGIVAFDYQAWARRYPEFSSVTIPLATDYFAEAGLYLDNSTSGLVTDLTARSLLLNLLTAHIAALNSGTNGQAPSGLVGRITSATQGSVSVSVDAMDAPGSAAWYMQTTYGAAYWAATARYRGMRYVPAPPRCANRWR